MRLDELREPSLELKLAHRPSVSPVVALEAIDRLATDIELESPVVNFAAISDAGSRHVAIERCELVLAAAVIFPHGLTTDDLAGLTRFPETHSVVYERRKRLDR